MLATVSVTWLSLETSQIIAWVSGSSCSSARMRSGDRASAITRNPPLAKRRTIADPVPGPTPVTIAIGLSVTDAASSRWISYHAVRDDMGPIGSTHRYSSLCLILHDYLHIKQSRFVFSPIPSPAPPPSPPPL